MKPHYPRLFASERVPNRGLSEHEHDLTLLIPAYNEEQRLPRTLAAAKIFLDDWGIDYRVVVIDNGSKDNTRRIADRFGDRFSTILQPLSGKGAAVRKGMLQATGSVVAFTDADLPYDLAALRHGVELVESGKCEVAFGARDVAGASVAVQRRWLRTIASAVFRSIVRRLVSKNITDTQCGLKIFSRAAAAQVFSRTTINGFAFDAEVVFLTRRLRLDQACIPVRLINEDGSTLSLTRHALPMLLDVLKIRWRELAGEYQWDVPGTALPEPAIAPQRAA